MRASRRSTYQVVASELPRIAPMLVSTGARPKGDTVYAVKSDGWRSHFAIDGRSGLSGS